MGARLDRWALGGLAAAGFYLFFLNAWGSVPLAGALAFACVPLARRALRGLPVRRRASAARVREELLRLAALPDAEAQAALAALVRRRWPGEDFALSPVLKHPEATLSAGDLLNAWKANRNAARLVVASTCPAEPRALAFARELHAPEVALVDSRALTRILRRCLPPDAPERRPDPRRALRRLACRMASSRVTPRNLLVAAALLLAYLRGGSPLCLFASLALLFHFGVALAQRRTGRRLFEA